jgi:hypothetical protein
VAAPLCKSGSDKDDGSKPSYLTMEEKEYVKFCWRLLTKHHRHFDMLWMVAVFDDGLWRYSKRAHLLSRLAKQLEKT